MQTMKCTSTEDSADFVVSGLPRGLTVLALMFWLQTFTKVDIKVDRLPQCHIMSITSDLSYFVKWLIMAAVCNRAGHYIFALWFLSIFLSFFPSPNLSGHRLDVYHTSTHGVALVRIYNAGMKCAAHGSLQIQDAKKSPKIAIWAPSHNFVGIYLRN